MRPPTDFVGWANNAWASLKLRVFRLPLHTGANSISRLPTNMPQSNALQFNPLWRRATAAPCPAYRSNIFRLPQQFPNTNAAGKRIQHVFRLPPLPIPSTTSNKALPTHQQSRLATKRACFNTQPPESGCLKCATSACAAAWFQHTAARRRLEKSCLRNVP